MIKDLYEAWITICHYNEEIIHDMGSEYVENPLKEELDIVNDALLELKAIKEAKPSEALNITKATEKYTGIDLTIIKQALLKAQEQDFYYNKIVIPFLNELAIILGINDMDEMLDKIKEQQKMLKIIFEKRVDMWHLVDLLEQDYEMYLAFCKSEGYDNEYILTEEEFELVKRCM